MSTWVWIVIACGGVLVGMAVGAFLVLRSFGKGMNW